MSEFQGFILQSQHEIAEILKDAFHCPGKGWLFFEELRVGTGFAAGNEQRIDAWAMSSWRSQGDLEKVAYEIKVTRSDWLKELRSPNKRRLALMLSNRFYIVTPEGIVKSGEVPPECGLIEIDQGRASKKIKAPRRDCLPPPWPFFASIARRIIEKEKSCLNPDASTSTSTATTRSPSPVERS